MRTKDDTLRSAVIAAAGDDLAAAHVIRPVDRYEARQGRLSAVARRLRRSTPDAGVWAILRTTGGRTLGLMRSLEKAGIPAWTPMEVRSWRRPRSRAMFERELAIVPSFVFVAADRLAELMVIAADPTNPHPAFAVFRHGGRAPLIADAEIESLRGLEQRHADARRRAQKRTISAGEKVRIVEGCFAGMAGKVVARGAREASTGVDGKDALIDFGRGFQAKIATFLLFPDQVEPASPSEGPAAAAA